MFRCTIRSRDYTIATGVWQFLPRIGERVVITYCEYKITMITYYMPSGNFSDVEVKIEVTPV